MDIIQGEQFWRYIGGTSIDYAGCSQIVLHVYNQSTKETAFTFVKVADPVKYPGSALLVASNDPAYEVMIFVTSEMTLPLKSGCYYMEAKRTIAGVEQPIVKSKVPFFTVTKTLVQ